MSSRDELQSVRLEKLARLEIAGMNPFSSKTNRTHSLIEVKTQFKNLEETQEIVTIAGRIMLLRGQGAILFLTLFDGTGNFQAVLKKDEISLELFELFNDTIDIGDFIELSGICFLTKRGEESLLVSNWTILTKSLLPLPDKWHGITDDDDRYRKRYLDILMNDEVFEIFKKRAKFWEVTRNFMERNGFMHVETPTLEITTGGAEANPFKSYHKDYDIDVFLRISVGELWQKRLMAAGYQRTYEIGRVYRNEGSSPDHLQEFTNMEFYMAYANYKDGMKLVRDMYISIAKEVFGTTKFTSRGHAFDLSDEWAIIDYQTEIKKQTGIDIFESSIDEMKAVLKNLHVVYTGDTYERLCDTLWKYCRKNISGPAFLVHHPVLVSPLSKVTDYDKRITERFQPIIAGTEVGNGFSELNDPLDQRKRFLEQQELIDRGDDEAMKPEWEFVEMLEHGMPPTCGFGFGERLFAILCDKPIREVTLFPLMKPKYEE